MKTIPTTLILQLALLLVACETNSTAEVSKNASATPSAEKALLGTWETVEIEVDYDTYSGSDTSAYELIREADFNRLYGAKPPQTVFTPDGKSKRTHRFNDGRISDVVNGLWKVHNADTLLFIEPNKTLYFKYTLTDDRLTLQGLTDSDADGEVDDKKRTEMRLVARARYNN